MNTYKLTTIFFLTLWIGTVLYCFFYKKEELNLFKDSEGNEITLTQEMLDEVYQFNSVMEIDESLLQEWEEMNRNIDSLSTGKALTVDSAATKWNSFTKWNTTRGNFVREIKPNGFAFGINPIRKMLHAIDSVNSTLRQDNNPDSLIHGVRVNLSHSFYRGKSAIDVLFVPIMSNGKNFIDLNGKPLFDDPDDMLLNTSTPCPELCN